MAFKIKTITAFVAEQADGTEGVLAFCDTAGHWLPLICADDERIKTMLSIAERIKKLSGNEYKILRFSQRADVTEETKKKFGAIL